MDRATLLPPPYGVFDMDVVADGDACDCNAVDLTTCVCPTIPAPAPESDEQEGA